MRDYLMKLGKSAKKTVAFFLTLCLLIGSMGWLDTASAICLHSSTRVEESEPEYTPNGAVVHTVKIIHSTVCNDCGEVLRTWDTTKSEGHEWDPTDSYCTKCGWVRPAPVCEHSSTSRVFQSEEYSQYDEIYHEHTRHYNIVCDSCGETIDTETETNNESHSFDSNGECEYCHYQQEQACTHTSTKKVYDDDQTVYENINDSSVHLTHYSYDVVCKKCGETIETGLTETEEEDHNFNSDGICRDCGYERQIDELKISLSVSSSTVKVGDTIVATATVSGGAGDPAVYWNVTCNGTTVLDTSINVKSVDVTADKAGDYVFTATAWDDNGNQSTATATVTAEPADCEHDNTERTYTDTEYEQIAGNEENHNIYKYYDVVCSDCGETIETHKCDGPETEAHHFDANGTCTDCGYVKATNPDELKISLSVSSSTVKVGETIIATATVTGGAGEPAVYWNVTCNGTTVLDTSINVKSIDVTADEAGEYVFTATAWDDDGNQSTATATVTAKPDDCEHDNTERTYTDTEYEQIAGNEENHNIYKYYDVVCSDCGETIETHKCDGPETEAHHFDTNGTCTDCGYIKATNPDELKISLSVSSSTVKVGETIIATATVTGGAGDPAVYWNVTCNGTTILDTSINVKSIDVTADEAGEYVITATAWDDNGNQSTATATVTAIPVDCKHENTKRVDTAPEYEQIEGNEENHNVYRYYDVVCSDCGETIETHKCDGPETEAHHFDANGKCTDCGYVKAAPSDELRAFVDVAQTMALVGEALEASATATGGDGNYKFAWKITKDDEEIHTTDTSIGPKYSWPADEEGTYVFTVTVVDGEGTTATADGAPIVVTECQHENTKEIELEAPIYTNNGDSGHTRTVKVRIECVDCGAVVVEETIVSHDESHDFSNGPCPCGQSDHVHHYEKVEIRRSNYVNETTEKHKVTITYVERCPGCGDQSEEKTEVVFEDHNYSDKDHIEADHQDGLGHRTFDRCVCGATIYTGYSSLSGCCKCNGHEWGNPYEYNGKRYRQCIHCNKVEYIEDACPVYGEHQWTIKYAKEHPHKPYWYCDCGEEKKMLHTMTTKVANCCECMGGHIWNSPVKLGNEYKHACDRCGLWETITPDPSVVAFYDVVESMNEIQDEYGFLSIWKQISMNATDKLTDYWGFTVPAESLKKFSSMFSTLWDCKEDIARISMDSHIMSSMYLPINVKYAAARDMFGTLKSIGLPEKDFEEVKTMAWESVIISMLNKDIEEHHSPTNSNQALEPLSQVNGVIGGAVEVFGDNLTSKAEKVGETIEKFINENEAIANKLRSEDPDFYQYFMDKKSDLMKNRDALKDGADKAKNAANKMDIFGYVLDGISVVCEGVDARNEAQKINKAFEEIAQDYDSNMNKLNQIINVAKTKGNDTLLEAAENVKTHLEEEYNGKIDHFLTEAGAFFTTIADEGAEAITKNAVEYAAGTMLLPLKALELGASALNIVTGLGEEYDLSLELMTLGTIDSEMNILGSLTMNNSAAMEPLWAELQIMGCDKAMELTKHNEKHDKKFINELEDELGIQGRTKEVLNSERQVYTKLIK